MGKLFIGLIVGLVLGSAGAIFLGGGAMMGAGVATGLSSGLCATVQAAQDLGFVTPEQVDEILAKAAAELGSTEVPRGEIAGSAAACASVLDQLKAAQ